MGHHYQISHEELLLLTGLLRLPPPLALGPRPAAGYSPAALSVALGAAAGSLAARGLLHLPDTGAQPTPHPGIAGALRLLAAQSCLLVAGSQGGRHSVGQAGLGADGEALLLGSPHPGVYSLVPARGHEAAVDHVVGLLPQAAGAPPQLAIPREALLAALDAAAAPLMGADVPDSQAAAFARSLGPAPARYAVVALRGAGDRQERRGLLVIGGASGAWCADDETAPVVSLHPLCPAGLRSRVADLVAWAVA